MVSPVYLRLLIFLPATVSFPGFPLGPYRSHWLGCGLLEQPTGLRKGLGLWRRAGWPVWCHSGGWQPCPLDLPASPGTHRHRWGSIAGARGSGAGWRGSPPGGGTAAGGSAGWVSPQAAAERESRGWDPGHGSQEPPPFHWTPGNSVCLVQVRLWSAERLNLSPDLPLTPTPILRDDLWGDCSCSHFGVSLCVTFEPSASSGHLPSPVPLPNLPIHVIICLLKTLPLAHGSFK